MQTAGILGGLAGILCRINRIGSSNNGRIQVRELTRINNPPETRTMVRTVLAMRRVEGFAPLFEPRIDDQADTPARSRNDKPRVPKGTRG